MFTKISVIDIIKDHISTLKKGRTNKISYSDIILFFLLPAVISSIIVYLGIPLNDGLVNALITSFAIFSALLFNLLLLVYDISEKNSEETTSSDPVENNRIDTRRKLLREIYVNVSFSILVSIVTVVILLTYFLKPNKCQFWMFDICSIQWLRVFIVYYLAIQFILTLFMILKRIYKLLSKAFNNGS
ncbi:conserved hypothetical protein [Rippkaea orientalis PCC 8801]|uniref:Uncharacterized protein n=1 Tax=Rippkaea orientalis (strain PCC 8801 / RF-1) TaxID=41431 RepID=B7JX58_RIPO1|nr:hypothetical protein [Rippkaea orientalis]ACK67046.1 conserved hypothetical protein [Rippkaea orientalis PCC 8801]